MVSLTARIVTTMSSHSESQTDFDDGTASVSPQLIPLRTCAASGYERTPLGDVFVEFAILTEEYRLKLGALWQASGTMSPESTWAQNYDMWTTEFIESADCPALPESKAQKDLEAFIQKCRQICSNPSQATRE